MSDWLLVLVGIAIGGAVGGLARYWVSGIVARRYGETFPWGTMVVNVSGAACIGIASLLLLRDPPLGGHGPMWATLVVGGLGSYTTVSSFTLQTLALARSGEQLRAVLNVVGSVVLCLAAAAAGHALAFALTAGSAR